MPAAAPRRSATTEPRRALLTPSASPSLGPPDRPPTKRPRLRSTPSSTISATPSTSNESTSSVDVNSARRASTIRVLNIWAQLAERYNKRLDEDDIVDLYSGAIIKDRGVLRGASRDYQFGHIAQPDGEQDYPDGDQDQEDSDQDDDDNELNALPPSETTTDDDAPISKKELLRGVPPLSASTDTEDLREFLEAEKKRRELVGGEEGDEDMSQEQLSALRKVLEEQSREREATIAKQSKDTTSTEHPPKVVVDTTPTRPSARVPPSDDESEDELAVWTHDESTAVYPVARDESEQDVREVERDVIELTESDSDSDSDAEFEALLVHPPRHNRSSPLRVPRPREVQQPLQSPPDSERGRSKSRGRPHPKIKSTDVTSKSASRPQSPIGRRKPSVTVSHRKKPSTSGEGGNATSNDAVSDQEAVSRTPPVYKGKCKEVPPFVEDTSQDKTLKSLGVVSRGRKRKRIASSSTNGDPPAQSPGFHTVEPKINSQSRRKSISQSPIALPRPDSPSSPSLDEDASTPVPFERTVAGSSRLLSSLPSLSKNRQAVLSVPVYESVESDSSRLTPHNCDSNSTPLSDAPIPVTHPYTLRLPSQPPPIFSSPYQGTPGLSLPAHPPLPVDPVQAQQAHYLLAQAMHQLSYLISATMPTYAPYASNPDQPWQHPPPPPPPPHAAYSTPVHHPPHPHGTCPYHTPSSSVSHSGLPPSSPVQSSMSPPVEQRARSRGRSKSRGRRVSFKLNSEEVVVSREHDVQTELHHSGQKIRKQTLEVKREKGKGKAIGESDDSPQLEERGSTPREVARGQTPGPPSRLKIDVARGRSLSRR